jgi:hypothetical protein
MRGRFWFGAFAARAVWFLPLLRWHLSLGFCVLAALVGMLAFARASAICFHASSVAPVRGGTYFSLPPQRKVGKRKRLTPLILVFA